MAKMRLNTGVFLIIAVLVALGPAGVPALGGEYHTGGSGSLCSDCHTVHSSKSGQTWVPSPYLLKYSGQVQLCLSCHDGADQNAPDIVSSGTSVSPNTVVVTQYSSKHGSSAGFFQSDYQAAPSNFGHDLVGPVTAPLSTIFSSPSGLLCSDCHDIHGSSNYRNLVSDPNPAHPGSFPIVLGTHMTEAIPVNTLTPNPSQAYDTGNVGFYIDNNLRGWCTDCHDMLAQDAQGTSPAHFSRHPTDIGIGSGSYGHTALSNWLSGTVAEGTGFGINVGDSAAGIPRVRFGSASGSSSVAAPGDTVTCLSCHKAHGSAHHAALIWPYRTDSADSMSGCQQCHHK